MTAQDLIDKYGPPDRVYLNNEMMIWHVQDDFSWFPAKVMYINKDFKSLLCQSFTAVQKAGLQGEITSFDGCYVDRPVRGSNSISAHAYGCAIDLNASKDRMFIADGSPMDDPKRLGTWSKAFVIAMTSSGVYFGGYFLRRSDPMHFSLAAM